MHTPSKIKQAALALACTTAFASGFVHAQTVAYGASEAYNFDISALPAGGLFDALGLLPLNLSTGIAPAPYAYTKSVFDSGVSPVIDGPNYRFSLATGALESAASSDVNGQQGGKTTRASSRTAELSFALDQSFVHTLLSLDASVLFSSASVSGSPGAFVANGQTGMLAATLASQYLLGPLSIDTDNLAPNWKIIDEAGLTVTLNRQRSHCLADYCDMRVDALHIAFENFLIAPSKLLDGEIAFGHSYAVMAVPEASSYGMMLAGLGLIGFVARRRAAYAV